MHLVIVLPAECAWIVSHRTHACLGPWFNKLGGLHWLRIMFVGCAQRFDNESKATIHHLIAGTRSSGW